MMRQRVFRSSTTARVAQSEAQRKEEQDKSLLRKEIRVAAAKGAPVKERLVQAELLREAAHTEIANRRSLELMLSFESERVRKKPVPPPYRGPLIRYHSKLGSPDVITFTGVGEFPASICATAPAYPTQPRCAVTGLPAKYRDPKTNLPFANIAAFKEIRRRFAS